MTLSICFLIFWWYFWTWIVRKILPTSQVSFLMLWGLSLSLVLLLLGIEFLLQWFNISLVDWKGIVLFLGMLGGYFAVLFFGIFKKKEKKSWLLLGVLLAVLGGLSYLLWNASLGISLWILLMAVYAEEYLKIGTSSLVFQKHQQLPSDFLFFSLIIAIGFSFFENGYYLFSQIIWFSEWENGMLTLSFWRGMISSLLHLLSTGLIALLLFKGHFFQSWFFKSIFVLLGAFFSGVLVHFLYDYTVIPSFLIYGVVLIGGYFFLTYLFYLSDQWYLKKE